MTSDRDALVRAICASPREDTPRLAFADWLDEHGHAAHAAFVRSDVAMSLRDEWDAERLRWEADLVPNVLRRQPWFAAAFPEPPPTAGYSWGGPVLTRRGFRWAARVWPRARPAYAAAPALFAAHPIERLDFFDHAPDFAWLLAQPWFPRLTGLGWTAGRCPGSALRPLLKAAPPHLVELDLASHALNPDGTRALGASAVFRNLERLELYGVGPRVVAAALDALAAAGPALRLRTLKIGFDSLRTTAAALAASLPPTLRVLSAAGTSLHSAGTRDLVEALVTSELKLLDLGSNGIGNEGAAAVFTSPRLAGLKVLNLKLCMVGDEALRVLLDSSPLADTLDLLDLTLSSASGDMRQAVKDRMGDRVRW
ncbi:Repeat-companion domain protein OS=Isosphaera pallida (strain ATCC 43644 / DSM 9630 / IS1B) GN=Isop_0392 PE=4 SV=1: LRR_6 [Gemmataceae bacterium]|nr:Repeat-companion domain protein OS=Isosphaera pallida (strain ATCC 43644 / DSM 9630 / IS1B) GN=Isop_0392 PE=4 SV=1: LRR_6 [Gemmataceae bacterium]VTU01082.1 Repeat-companion domain protein OS=Isosphaera pallida (strain ATCC 43644 / DSM 9630 / IS1B) GN=Isop_0392 PE=4 SV=1: LRR_6 [Gemmataceae bacterium]